MHVFDSVNPKPLLKRVASLAVAVSCLGVSLVHAQTNRAAMPGSTAGHVPTLSASLAREIAGADMPSISSSRAVDDGLPDDPSVPVQESVHPDAKQPADDRGVQTKRILGIMPNFSSVSADERLPKLTPKDKFVIAGKNTFDYSSFFIAAIQAGVAMNGASYPEFHQGVAGYGRYYWHTLADTADENFMVGGLFPVVFRQDPRFYTLGHGSFGHRALYAASRVIISRSDAGNPMPNFSEIVGAGAAAGVSSLYYPTHYRTWTKVGQKWLTSSVIDGANFTFKEFWPTINHKVFHTH
ncbi:hypothetical protein Terro_0938 [Terriglobus roseus DSM 18391]|uniref:Uncharacterized protein n=1 Tax=Terriglobus roseus (strain DSM 18391 / NRRL B-41598 / KBS 63) TaxID=926566 RepID=I3ZDE2_TERRK|nr:hypothetical protein [Terriglobus roseus]AFL87260.1 hypothetical protein Terro_0938 [Terriglobus roseus DSM 18391]